MISKIRTLNFLSVILKIDIQGFRNNGNNMTKGASLRGAQDNNWLKIQ